MRKEVLISIIALILVAGVFLFIAKNMLGGSITGLAIDSSPSVSINNTNIDEGRIETTGKNYIVEIDMFKFIPADLRIRVGDSVTWVNYDKAKHEIYTGVNEDGIVLIDSGPVLQGKSYTQTFDTAGVYEYRSGPFPYVQGIIIVEQPRS